MLEGDYLGTSSLPFQLDIRKDVEIIVNGYLSFQPSKSGNIILSGPSSMASANGIIFGSPVQIIGSGVVTFNSDKDINGIGSLDCLASSAIDVSSSNITHLNLFGADVNLPCARVSANSANVLLRPSGIDGSMIHLGPAVHHSSYDLTDNELDKITTTGTLTVGSNFLNLS